MHKRAVFWSVEHKKRTLEAETIISNSSQGIIPYREGKEMVKSIRLLLLIAVIQISFSSCLLWKESFLSLKQTNAYFLILIVGISVLCAGINYFHTADQSRHSILHVQKKVSLVYCLLSEPELRKGPVVSAWFSQKASRPLANCSRNWLTSFYPPSFSC